MRGFCILLLVVHAKSYGPNGQMQTSKSITGNTPGSDDLLFGLCDFEQNTCGWNDTSRGDFKWRLHMANISSIPGVDHTTGEPWGKVMHVNGSKAGITSTAVLERALLNRPAITCQMSFWYHLYGARDSVFWGEFILSAVDATVSSDLWTTNKIQTVGWENATVLIGNRIEGTKLVFTVDPAFYDEQDVMLDDITFSHCSEGDVPPGSNMLTCDFDNDTCAWYHDLSTATMWKRAKTHPFGETGPESDHTSGSGYYMFIGTNYGTNPSMTARVVGYPEAHKSQCLSFWYHIYGGSIGSLKFITKQPGEKETVIWMRSGTQGNKWRFVDLTLPSSDLPLQFIFEAVLGGTAGSIAIDDVIVSGGVDGSCQAERECTFQASMCGMQPDPSADFSWNRTTATLSANPSSPPTDHTLGTAEGYYLSASLWKHSRGSRAAMQTAVHEATPASGECWMFWYHMEGEKAGEFNIFLEQALRGGVRRRQHLWSRRGEQGELWRHGRATVHSPDAPYRIIFEAVAGEGSVGDIAIDDLDILNGPCPPEGFCDFEMDLCGWLNRPHNSSSLDWDWTSAGTAGGTFRPEVDHTTNSALGHYMMLQLDRRDTKTAHLESEHMDPVSSGCLHFWLHMDSWGVSDRMYLTVYMNESGILSPLWNRSGNQGDVWQEIMIDFTSSSRHQILFEGKNDGDEGNIALDDVFIRTSITCAELLPTTPAPTTVAPTPSPSPQDCTFEKDLCEWEQDTEDGLDWLRQNGRQANGSWLGPTYDHTLGSNKGFYLVLNMSRDQDPKPATISVPVASQASEFCVGFWYYMFGPSVSRLDLRVQTGVDTSAHWTRSGTQPAEWLNAQVTIHVVDIQKVLFSAQSSSGGHGFIAIDDITFREGQCRDQDPCGFESQSLCGFEQDVTESGKWIHVTGTTERGDHTYGTALGHYMAVLSADLQSPTAARLLAPDTASTPGMCLRFWHWVSAQHSDSLGVRVLQEGELGPVLWTLPGHGSSSGWQVAEVTISSPVNFRVAFSADLSTAPASWILLDDVSLRPGSCTPVGSCDFESGLCTWRSGSRRQATHTHDWFHADGYSQGPGFDHTTLTPDGRFLLSKVQDRDSVAELESEWLQPGTEACLSLWYHLAKSTSGKLQIIVRTLDNKEEAVFVISQSGDTWKHMSHSLQRTTHFQILIVAESAGEGHIAIDDILLTPGQCTGDVPIHDFTPCQFEENTCGWQDVSVGQFKWDRDRNGTTTENTGPSVDHTTGTEMGWYMAVEASDGEHNSYAVLQSPAMQQASANCTFQFYYHMYGEGIGELRVLLLEGSRSTPLLQLSGNHGDEWHQAELGVGRTPQVFHLLFEATRTFSELGDIAIDDIALLNCTLPEAADECPAGYFTCANRVCVETSRLCDFTDDCGDRSEEVQCELKGYAERCSFEQGLCSWESGGDWASRGSKWTRQRGEAAWPTHGPPRDHTRNTAAGYYMVPGYPLSPGQTSEILSGTLLPSTKCTVRFYLYNQGGDHPDGSLTVRLRTEHSGSSDAVIWSGGAAQGFHWRRAQATFYPRVNSKIVFQFVDNGESRRGQVALDDISFSPECAHDPNNSPLPGVCGEEGFFCWRSEGVNCIPANKKCNYDLDCPLGEDEETCGPCSFEYGSCDWQDKTDWIKMWQLQKASEHTDPPVDHTTGSGGHYMQSNSSQDHKAILRSPPLPVSSPYCQMRFHFHMGGSSPGTLGVSLRNATGHTSLLWSRSANSSAPWVPAVLPLGKQQGQHTVMFSNEVRETLQSPSVRARSSVALDDISFHNCETSYQPPDLATFSCSFDQDLCDWVQGALDDLDWQRRSGPTDTINTGPLGDHTSSRGHYMYLKSSHPSKAGDVAQLNSPLVPPTSENGYCLSVWYHMYGPTVGSLQVFVKNIVTGAKTLVWQRRQTQDLSWQVLRHHVVEGEVHQIVLEASVGGQAGDIAVDDITFAVGACPSRDLCDFENGDCNWVQLETDDFDWRRVSGETPTGNTGPAVDHTTGADHGHYFYLPSSNQPPSARAVMASPEFHSGKGKCLQFWYHMFGQGMGTLNVYKEPVGPRGSTTTLLVSHSGDMGKEWRFAQAQLPDSQQQANYRIVVEGVRGSSEQGDMAIDDVLVTDAGCPPAGQCDFEQNACGWTNLYGVDETDWLRGQGHSPEHSTGPSVDHTFGSSLGYYMYVDSSVGNWGARAMLFSEALPPDTRGHCLTFWYQRYGQEAGTLSLLVTHNVSQYDTGRSLWTDSGDDGKQWLEGRVSVESNKTSWFLFLYQRGKYSSGVVALDDIRISPGSCDTEDPTKPSSSNDSVAIALGVVVPLVVIGAALASLYVWRRKHPSEEPIIEHDMLDQSSVSGFYECDLNEPNGAEYRQSFPNNLYDHSEDPMSDVNGMSSA